MPVDTRGAVIRSAPGRYEVVDLVVDDPRPGEVQVQLVAAGLCHTDDHLAHGGMPVARHPICGGHEGSGVVTAVGPHTRGFSEGDHVVFSFIPACGRCRWCSSGRQYLCDLGAGALMGARFDDRDSFRFALPDGTPVGQMCGLGTFAGVTTVAAESAVRIPADIPLDAAALASCSVGTGWGSAVRVAEVAPGDTVVVMGVGGVGINAVQGAAFAGASHVIAVDPVEFKRTAALGLGATHAVADMEEAGALARDLTGGQGADAAVVTVGVTTGAHVAQAFWAVRKGGTVVVTGVGNAREVGIPIPVGMLTLAAKQLRGTVYGNQNPHADVLRLLRLYQEGHLELDGLITQRYTLDEVNEGFEDMHAGKNIRGVLVFG